MQGNEGFAFVVLWKLRSLMEGDAQRRRMRLKQYVRRDDFAREIWSLSDVARVFVVTNIVPRPTIETALFDASYVIRWQIVAEQVTLIGCAPEQPSGRLHSEARTISNACGIDVLAMALRIESQNIGAISFRSPRDADWMRLGKGGELRPSYNIQALGDI